ncbi:axonemal dynein light intermediate polypeptide 1 isoform X1 [Halyomorpha halys]|uniref:axonemal dynein light intermediate polypeptide 1 isoform X1 n=1 Tax=Halyomorpha halys TaxID=286706 RepID=UPI0006D4FF24|nr:33 kDa inner dynein arm light chain, axonemal-like isoform X1 [Halyomorpha halys]
MINEVIDLKNNGEITSSLVDLTDPQPWFLRFTEPIFEEKKRDEKTMFPWPPGAPLPLVFKTEVPLQEVLDFVSPPIKISEDGENWRQQVSDEPTNRTYDAFLNKCLEDSLNRVKSRFSGFCPYRNRVYRDMFSEVIRLVTVEMKERGLLLLRVKNDIDTTVDRMERLYKSSMGYGVRKQLRVEERKLKLEMKIDDIREETYILRLMSKNFVAKSKAGVEDLRQRKEKLLQKKKFELELLKRTTCVIEKTIFQVIAATTEKQRKRFYKACLLYKDATEEEEEKDQDITGIFTEEKVPTRSSTTIFVRESDSYTRSPISASSSSNESPEGSKNSTEEIQ